MTDSDSSGPCMTDLVKTKLRFLWWILERREAEAFPITHENNVLREAIQALEANPQLLDK